MNNIKEKLNKYVIAFSNNVIVKTIANGMARILPVTIVGSIATLISSIPYAPYTDFLKSSGLASVLQLGSTMTNDLISIYVVVALAYEMAKVFKKSEINAIFVSIVSFFIVTPLTMFPVDDKAIAAFTLKTLGSRGMFVAMIVGIIATRLYILFMDKGFKIKMHPSVPPAIAGSFESLFPVISVAAIFIVINWVFSITPFGDVHSFIYTILQKPLEGASDSLFTMLLIAFIGEFFWWFGIHGSNVTSAVTQTLYTPLALANAAALASGAALPFVLNGYFLGIYKGPRHLVLAAMLFYLSKSKQNKAVGQVAIIPGIFSISEPMKFGLPMIFNPMLFIPMTFAPVISLAIAYFATTIGFLPRVGINLPWTMPPFISGFLAGGLPGVAVQLIQAVAIFLLYLPFFKAFDKQKCKEEAIVEANEETVV